MQQKPNGEVTVRRDLEYPDRIELIKYSTSGKVIRMYLSIPEFRTLLVKSLEFIEKEGL